MNFKLDDIIKRLNAANKILRTATPGVGLGGIPSISPPGTASIYLGGTRNMGSTIIGSGSNMLSKNILSKSASFQERDDDELTEMSYDSKEFVLPPGLNSSTISSITSQINVSLNIFLQVVEIQDIDSRLSKQDLGNLSCKVSASEGTYSLQCQSVSDNIAVFDSADLLIRESAKNKVNYI